MPLRLLFTLCLHNALQSHFLPTLACLRSLFCPHFFCPHFFATHQAVTFLKRIKEVVEDPRRLLLDV